jgi:hypothetical protein
MREDSRFFKADDPFGRTWTVEFRWLQNAISIRHADAVDLRYYLSAEGEERREAVIALPHPLLTAEAARLGRQMTDAWCLHLASAHLEGMIRNWEDMDKSIVTLSPAIIAREAAAMARADAERDEAARLRR